MSILVETTTAIPVPEAEQPATAETPKQVEETTEMPTVAAPTIDVEAGNKDTPVAAPVAGEKRSAEEAGIVGEKKDASPAKKVAMDAVEDKEEDLVATDKSMYSNDGDARVTPVVKEEIEKTAETKVAEEQSTAVDAMDVVEDKEEDHVAAEKSMHSNADAISDEPVVKEEIEKIAETKVAEEQSTAVEAMDVVEDKKEDIATVEESISIHAGDVSADPVVKEKVKKIAETKVAEEQSTAVDAMDIVVDTKKYPITADESISSVAGAVSDEPVLKEKVEKAAEAKVVEEQSTTIEDKNEYPVVVEERISSDADAVSDEPVMKGKVKKTSETKVAEDQSTTVEAMDVVEDKKEDPAVAGESISSGADTVSDEVKEEVEKTVETNEEQPIAVAAMDVVEDKKEDPVDAEESVSSDADAVNDDPAVEEKVEKTADTKVFECKPEEKKEDPVASEERTSSDPISAEPPVEVKVEKIAETKAAEEQPTVVEEMNVVGDKKEDPVVAEESISNDDDITVEPIVEEKVECNSKTEAMNVEEEKKEYPVAAEESISSDPISAEPNVEVKVEKTAETKVAEEQHTGAEAIDIVEDKKEDRVASDWGISSNYDTDAASAEPVVKEKVEKTAEMKVVECKPKAEAMDIGEDNEEDLVASEESISSDPVSAESVMEVKVEKIVETVTEAAVSAETVVIQ